MKYESELIKEIVDTRGHEKSSLHYESECIESWIDEAKGSYPKLCDYQSEWLSYINKLEGGGSEQPDPEPPIGEFPYETLIDVTEATLHNVVPYAYKSATLKGSTKYRDIDTGDILDTFDETKNLELVSVKVPVLTTTGKNLWNEKDWSKGLTSSTGVVQTGGTYDGFRYNNELISVNGYDKIYCQTFAELDGVSGYRVAEYDLNKTFLRVISSNSPYHTPSNDCKYIRVHFDLRYNPNQTVPTDDIPTYGVVATEPITSYEPYKTNNLTTPEDVTLRGIGKVKDELDCLTGEVTERIGEIVLDGKNNIKISISSSSSKYPSITRFWVRDGELTNVLRNANEKIMCDKLPVRADGDYEKITASTGFDIHITTTKLSEETVEAFKEYLSQNPITVQYPLNVASVKTDDLTVIDQDGSTLSKIKPIEGTMHLSTSGTPIKPTFNGEIPVEATKQNLASFIGE